MTGNMATCMGCGVRVRSDTTTGRHKCARREDLRVMVDIDYRGNSPRQEPRPVTDAELAGMGLADVDRVRVESVARQLAENVGNLGWGLSDEECSEIAAFVASRLRGYE